MKKITLVKSLIGAKPIIKKNANSLGLKKIGDSITLKADAGLDGKLRMLAHLVSVEDVENA